MYGSLGLLYFSKHGIRNVELKFPNKSNCSILYTGMISSYKSLFYTLLFSFVAAEVWRQIVKAPTILKWRYLER